MWPGKNRRYTEPSSEKIILPDRPGVIVWGGNLLARERSARMSTIEDVVSNDYDTPNLTADGAASTGELRQTIACPRMNAVRTRQPTIIRSNPVALCTLPD